MGLLRSFPSTLLRPRPARPPPPPHSPLPARCAPNPHERGERRHESPPPLLHIAGAGASARRRRPPLRDPPPPLPAALLPPPCLPRLQALELPRHRSRIPPPLPRPPPEAPLICVFVDSRGCEPFFRFTLDPPDLIPPERFSLVLDDVEGGSVGGGWHFHGCRHGRVLIINRSLLGCRQVQVWDPVTGDQHCVAVPPELDYWNELFVQGAVFCAASDKGHVHGGCHSSPFKVVLVCANQRVAQAFACVYSSETGVWGNLISTESTTIQYTISVGSRSILVGDSLYWTLSSYQDAIFEFDLDRQSLAVIEVPSDVSVECRPPWPLLDCTGRGWWDLLARYFILERAVMGVEGLLCWTDGVAGWLPGETIELDKLLSLRSWVGTNPPRILDIGGDDNVMFLQTSSGVFMVHLESMQFKKLFESPVFTDCRLISTSYYPFTSFCAARHGHW